MTPLDFSDADLAAVREQLGEQAGLNRTLNCLEWGAGGSTLHFPTLLQSLGKGFTWFTVEHDMGWYQKVVEALAGTPIEPFVEVHLEQKKEDASMTDYVNFPLRLYRRHSFILVDGRMRRRCLKVASKLLAPGGVVMLHDAERPWYHCAFDEFTTHWRTGSKLWVGRIDSAS